MKHICCLCIEVSPKPVGFVGALKEFDAVWRVVFRKGELLVLCARSKTEIIEGAGPRFQIICRNTFCTVKAHGFELQLAKVFKSNLWREICAVESERD